MQGFKALEPLFVLLHVRNVYEHENSWELQMELQPV
jgi:hypothetical protein